MKSAYCLDSTLEMSQPKVLQLEFDVAHRARDGFAVRRGKNFFLLHCPATDVIEVACGVLLVQRV
jgi:hypothetical protein